MIEKTNVKGAEGGLCNRSACQAPGATWYNASTMKYYCEDCAREINKWSLKDDGFRICVFGVGEPTFNDVKFGNKLRDTLVDVRAGMDLAYDAVSKGLYDEALLHLGHHIALASKALR